MKKIERLLNLVSALLDAEKPLSRQSIRERIPGAYSENDESFRRTFERDKDELRALGIPISLNKVPGTAPPVDGYQILKVDYEADHPVLEADEIAALHLASNLFHLSGEDTESIFYKMGGVLQENKSALSEIPTEVLDKKIMIGINERFTILFDYKDEQREVNPYRLVFSAGNWYLIGYDKLREDFRHFRADRIEGKVELTDQKFELIEESSEISHGPPWRYGEEEKNIELKINKSHAAWALELLGNDAKYKELSDGSIIVSEIVRDWSKFLFFLFSFLDSAEILSPPEAREEVIDWLKAMT